MFPALTRKESCRVAGAFNVRKDESSFIVRSPLQMHMLHILTSIIAFGVRPVVIGMCLRSVHTSE